VVAKGQPLEFWAWHPSAPLRRGVWDIPIPVERLVVRPTALLVPLVGFDDAGYRLGYGGGYYDRTLAVMRPRPLTIGIGYELGRLATIHPQPHDIQLDAIVTEAGLARAQCGERGQSATPERGPDGFADVDEDPNSRASYASPPCFMHELDPAYLGLERDRPAPSDSDDVSEEPEPGGSGAPHARPGDTRRE
jgi:hypothetical protein